MQIRAIDQGKMGGGASRRNPTLVSILVVDDAATMRTILRNMLAQLGFKNVDEAEDGKTAFAKIQGKPYDLIISDWHMAPMDGLELLKKVRHASRPNQNRFIFSTSESSWGSQTTAKIEGAEAFITKPFTLNLLQQKIATVLRN